MSSQCGN